MRIGFAAFPNVYLFLDGNRINNWEPTPANCQFELPPFAVTRATAVVGIPRLYKRSRESSGGIQV